MSFERNVFVNCPFDDRFLPLLQPLLFTIIYLDLSPRIALERKDSGESRLDKLVELIRESKYSIHDLSRSEAAAAGELYRLNMPFELGLDYGCRLLGVTKFRQKRTLVLESVPHRYKAAISDLFGADVECHYHEPYKIIGVVRNWLKSICLPTAAGPARIEAAFTEFMTAEYNALTPDGFSAVDTLLCRLASCWSACSDGSINLVASNARTSTTAGVVSPYSSIWIFRSLASAVQRATSALM